MITLRKLHRPLLTSQMLHFALPCGCFSPKCLRGVWETGRGFPEGLPNREHPCGRCSQGQRPSGDRRGGVPETGGHYTALDQAQASGEHPIGSWERNMSCPALTLGLS